MNRFLPLIFLIVIIILGFIYHFLNLLKMRKRLDFTNEYRDKFIELINHFTSTYSIKQDTYAELTEKVSKMQAELGEDGIMAYMHDPLKNVSCTNYQVLVNFLPELR